MSKRHREYMSPFASPSESPSDGVSDVIEPGTPTVEPEPEPAPPKAPATSPAGRIVHADCEVVYRDGVYRILEGGWSQKVNGIGKWTTQRELEAALVEWRRGR